MFSHLARAMRASSGFGGSTKSHATMTGAVARREVPSNEVAVMVVLDGPLSVLGRYVQRQSRTAISGLFWRNC